MVQQLLRGIRLGRSACGSVDRFAQSVYTQNFQLHSIHEDSWGTSNSVQLSVVNIFLYLGCVDATVQGSVKFGPVQAKVAGVFFQRRQVESFLILKKYCDVLKELSLCVGSIGSFCRLARVLMHVQWEIADHKTHLVSI